MPALSSKSAYAVLNIVKYFRAIDPEMPSQFIEVFLTVGARPEITTRELMLATDISQSAMSRATRALGDRQLNGADGHRLIKGTPHFQDSRVLLWTLTTAGESLYKEVIATLEGTPTAGPDHFKKNKKEKPAGKLKPVMA